MGKKTPANSGKPWSASDEARVVAAVRRNVDTSKIAQDLGRSEAAIRACASRQEVSLLPKDK